MVLVILRVTDRQKRASMTFAGLTGLVEKLSYLESNRMKSILLQSSIFNSTLGTSIQLDGTAPSDKKMDLLQIDPSVGSDNHLQNLTKLLNRKSELNASASSSDGRLRDRYAFDHRSAHFINR